MTLGYTRFENFTFFIVGAFTLLFSFLPFFVIKQMWLYSSELNALNGILTLSIFIVFLLLCLATFSLALIALYFVFKGLGAAISYAFNLCFYLPYRSICFILNPLMEFFYIKKNRQYIHSVYCCISEGKRSFFDKEGNDMSDQCLSFLHQSIDSSFSLKRRKKIIMELVEWHDQKKNILSENALIFLNKNVSSKLDNTMGDTNGNVWSTTPP